LFRYLLLPVLFVASTPVLGAAPQPTPDFPAARLAPPACALATEIPTRPLALPELVDIALCRAPATRAAWAGVRAAAEGEVQARAAYGPRLDASIGPTASYRRISGGGLPVLTDSSASATASLSINWLLYDFGGREARVSAAEAGRAGALASFADRAQALVLETGIAYNSSVAAAQTVEAQRANLTFAQNSLDAATARERAGIAIKSDRLQADAAFARAQLQLREAEGNLETQLGRLATALSLPPSTRLALAAAPQGTAQALRQSADALIAEADRLRPDLRLQEANVAQARAFVRQAEAARRPSVALGAGPSLTGGTGQQDVASGSAGLTLSIPLFDSGGRTSAVREARASAEQAEANLEDSRQQAALDVWSRYQSLAVDASNLETARRLLASAEEAAALAQGRYRSGLATITELLDAQASLASAREQLVSAELAVRSSELQLARAIGQIGDAVQ
jgi:outer membrane protein